MIEAGSTRVPVSLRLLDLGKGDSGEDLGKIAQRPVFILSTGRTGTQYLAEDLDGMPGVRAVHEPPPSRGLRFWTVAYLQGAVDRSAMTGALRRYRSGSFRHVTEPVYVESNNFLAGFAESLIEVFDEPAIIHVVRDPRTYVRSAINNGADSGVKGVANRLIPFAHLPLDTDQEHSVIRRSARYWLLVNSNLLAVGERYSNYALFRYEDLFDSASGEFDRLIETVGVAGGQTHPRPRQERVNASKRSVLMPWDRWSPGQRQAVIDTCGALMTRFDYDL